jgi:hypothetical protein
MFLSRVRIAITAAAVAGGAVLALAPGGAQSQAVSGDAPCRLVWDGDESGGDTQTTHAELTLSGGARQPDGSFMMFGAGQGTVTYHTASGCTITGGNPFTANFTAILNSEDGRTAEVDITSMDPSHPITTRCSLGESTIDADPSEPPTVTVALADGASAPYSLSQGAGPLHHKGKTGTVTLHYCTNAGH